MPKKKPRNHGPCSKLLNSLIPTTLITTSSPSTSLTHNINEVCLYTKFILYSHKSWFIHTLPMDSRPLNFYYLPYNLLFTKMRGIVKICQVTPITPDTTPLALGTPSESRHERVTPSISTNQLVRISLSLSHTQFGEHLLYNNNTIYPDVICFQLP